jgi:DNA-binding NarL/FixJ family response regulator
VQGRILIADDHEVSRVGIRNILETDSRWEACGEAIDGPDAIEQVRRLKPDLVVMDAAMDGVVEVMRQIRQFSPATKVILSSIYDVESVAKFAATIGGNAFLSKSQFGMHLNETA